MLAVSVRDDARSRFQLFLIGAQLYLTVSLAAEHRGLAWLILLGPRSPDAGGVSETCLYNVCKAERLWPTFDAVATKMSGFGGDQRC